MDEAAQVVNEALDHCFARNTTDWGKIKNEIRDSRKITFAPIMVSSLITFDTLFSLPGIGVELKITVSPGLIVTFLWMFARQYCFA